MKKAKKSMALICSLVAMLLIASVSLAVALSGPGAPTGLSAGGGGCIGPSAPAPVVLTWTAPSPPADGYRVIITNGSDTLVNFATANLTYTTNLGPGTYQWHVRSFNLSPYEDGLPSAGCSFTATPPELWEYHKSHYKVTEKHHPSPCLYI